MLQKKHKFFGVVECFLLARTSKWCPQISIEYSNQLMSEGIRKFDALHIACALHAECDYFLTTDDKVLNKDKQIEGIKITGPFGFVKEMDYDD